MPHVFVSFFCRMQKKVLSLSPENQIFRTPMTDTPKHTINTCTEAYVSCAAVLVVAACFFLLTHIYSVCVSPITCVGTALWGDTACTARNFGSNFSGFGRQTKFSTSGNFSGDVTSETGRRQEILSVMSPIFAPDVGKFYSSLTPIYQVLTRDVFSTK